MSKTCSIFSYAELALGLSIHCTIRIAALMRFHNFALKCYTNWIIHHVFVSVQTCSFINDLFYFVSAKICLFYTVFYGVLVALVVVCMWVFFQTLDPRTPKWQLKESRIGDNPGLGFRPLPPDDQAESTLIWFKAANDDSTKKNYQYWIDSLTEFLKGIIIIYSFLL